MADIQEITARVLPIFRSHNVKRAAVFGSVARGEAGPDSDIDILIEVERPFALSQFVALKRTLEAALQKPVDVVEYTAIKPAFARNILKDAAVIYEQR